MLHLMLAAAVSAPFTPERALAAVARDDHEVAACTQTDPHAMLEALSLKQISSDPQLYLVELFHQCVCGAQNCPYWVYRVNGSSAVKLLDGYAIDVKIVTPEHGDGPPEIDEIAHESAALQNETDYRYRDGAYVKAGLYEIFDSERKPATKPLAFAAGASSARLAGRVAFEWGDAYAFQASAGQVVQISDVRAERAIVVRVHGAHFDRTVTAATPLRLPANGNYTLTVDVGNDDNPEITGYALTLSIR